MTDVKPFGDRSQTDGFEVMEVFYDLVVGLVAFVFHVLATRAWPK